MAENECITIFITAIFKQVPYDDDYSTVALLATNIYYSYYYLLYIHTYRHTN